MTRFLHRLIFRLRMLRFRRAPVNPRGPDGRFVSRRDWRLSKMREGVGG
jgi:hypothetical protein